MNITKHFTWEEAMCRDGTEVPEALKPFARLLAGQLEIIRTALGYPMIVHSWYRTNAYNKKIGGAAQSQHLHARACDFSTKFFKPETIFFVVDILSKFNLIKQGGLFLYDTFVHYDIRGKKVRADFRKQKSNGG